jgi:hypothetical protein
MDRHVVRLQSGRGRHAPKEQCKSLNAEITKEGEVWKAVCSRATAAALQVQTSTMEGRAVGPVVMFQGHRRPRSEGRRRLRLGGARERQAVVGFYTSAYAVGTFSMTRVP